MPHDVCFFGLKQVWPLGRVRGLWMNFYNHHRPHQAMNNQFPMAAWRAGTDRIEAAKTVDMPLRLDNANALPTYPQQTQKQQQEAA
jgi:putative transposase